MLCLDGQCCPFLTPPPRPRRSRAIRDARVLSAAPAETGAGTATALGTGRTLRDPAVFQFTSSCPGAPEPFFLGHWPGTRCDWTGDVGVSFVPLVSGCVTSLGRPAPLQQSAKVTLWSVATESSVASADVGPDATVEGNYAFAPLAEPFVLMAGSEYRITQHCSAGMLDKWFDGSSTPEEAAKQTSSALRFVGGVCRNEGGYPKRFDGAFRRAGMVNFKFARDGLDTVQTTQEELTSTLESIAATEEPGQLELIGSYVAVLSSVLRILTEDFNGKVCEALVAVAPEADVMGAISHSDTQMSSLVSPSSSSQACAGSIFDPRFPGQLAYCSEFCRARQAGAPEHCGEPCVFVSHQTGVVFAVASTLFRNGRPLHAPDIASNLRRGVVFRRTSSAVMVYSSLEMRHGRAFQLGQVTENGSLAPELEPAASPQRGLACPPQVVHPSNLEVVQGEALDESEAPRAKVLDETAVNGSWMGCSPNGFNDVLKFDWLAGSKS